MKIYEAIKVLRGWVDDGLLDPAQRQAIRLAIAALDDVARRENEERDNIERWKRKSLRSVPPLPLSPERLRRVSMIRGLLIL